MRAGDVRLTSEGGVYLLLKELPAEGALLHGFLTLVLAQDERVEIHGEGHVWEPATAWLEKHTRPLEEAGG